MGQIASLFLISGPSHPVISHRERKPQHSSECKTQHFPPADPPNSDCCSRHAESSRSQSKLINEIHRIRPEDLCRPNILPCQVFDIQKGSFQLNFVFDELGCQPCAKPDQAEHHGAGFGRELALFGVALQQTMRMGQDAMGGCVAHQSNKICELILHGTAKCPQVLVPAVFGLLQPTSQRKRTIRAGLRAQCLLAPQPETWTQPVVSASAARPTSLAYPVTSVSQACSTGHASPATSRHNKWQAKKAAMYSVSLGQTQFAISGVMCFPMDSGPNTNSLGKTQFPISCVMCFPMDSGPNTNSLGKTQFAISCVMCFPMDLGPNTDSLGKTQFGISCVMCFPMDLGLKHHLLEIPKPKQLKTDHITVDKAISYSLFSTSQRKLVRR